MKILATDIGNSRISMGCFENHVLSWRRDIETSKFIDDINLPVALNPDICVISRVSLPALAAENALRHALHCQILSVNTADSPLVVRYAHPEKLGHDRIANALGARYHAPEGAIVVDLGTATHFDIVDPEGVFLGGPILLGVEAMVSSLSQRIPHLPEISPDANFDVISETTESAIDAGAILGTAGAVEKIVRTITHQLGFKPKIILTGGNAPLLAPHLDYDLWLPDLTLEGLCRYALLVLERDKNCRHE